MLDEDEQEERLEYKGVRDSVLKEELSVCNLEAGDFVKVVLPKRKGITWPLARVVSIDEDAGTSAVQLLDPVTLAAACKAHNWEVEPYGKGLPCLHDPQVITELEYEIQAGLQLVIGEQVAGGAAVDTATSVRLGRVETMRLKKLCHDEKNVRLTDDQLQQAKLHAVQFGRGAEVRAPSGIARCRVDLVQLQMLEDFFADPRYMEVVAASAANVSSGVTMQQKMVTSQLFNKFKLYRDARLKDAKAAAASGSSGGSRPIRRNAGSSGSSSSA
jgi:hypothetical protein